MNQSYLLKSLTASTLEQTSFCPYDAVDVVSTVDGFEVGETVGDAVIGPTTTPGPINDADEAEEVEEYDEFECAEYVAL